MSRPWKAWILEPVVDEGVHDGHGFGRDLGVEVDLQTGSNVERVDVDGRGSNEEDGKGRSGQNVEERLGPVDDVVAADVVGGPTERRRPM